MGDPSQLPKSLSDEEPAPSSKRRGAVANLSVGKAKSVRETARKRPADFEPDSRLLGLLASLVFERSGLTYKTVLHRAGLDWSYEKWKQFRKGEFSLTDDDAQALAAAIKSSIRDAIAEDDDHILVRDLAYLRASALDVLGDDYFGLTDRDDQVELDKDLLYALDIDRKTQDPEKVQDCAHGFWFVIRRSSLSEEGSGLRYRVALMSINSNAYIRLMGAEKRPVRVMTSIPHFSLRTGPVGEDESENTETVRGQVVQTFEPKQVLNFIGTTEVNYPPLFMMTLKLNDTRPHATEAFGIVMTNNYRTIVSGPVGAAFVPLSPKIAAMRERLTEKKTAASEELSWLYREQRDSLEKLVGVYGESELLEKFAPLAANNSVKNIVRRLAKAHQDAAGGESAGYFSVPYA